MAAVSSLPEHERTVTVLRYFNGHSVIEIADLTGRPVGTITKQLSRALKRLRDKLDKTGRHPICDGDPKAQV